VTEWARVYSKIPLGVEVQRDLTRIRQAFNAGDDVVTVGNVKFIFAREVPPGYLGGANRAFPDEIVLTSEALAQADNGLMKTIIHENIHNYRYKQGFGEAGFTGESVASEESMLDQLTDSIFNIGRDRSWW
jgi:hypothetical protein